LKENKGLNANRRFEISHKKKRHGGKSVKLYTPGDSQTVNFWIKAVKPEAKHFDKSYQRRARTTRLLISRHIEKC